MQRSRWVRDRDAVKPDYDLGEAVTLTATSFTDSVFAGWIGDLNTIDNPIALQMNGNKADAGHIRLHSHQTDRLEWRWRIGDCLPDEDSATTLGKRSR